MFSREYNDDVYDSEPVTAVADDPVLPTTYTRPTRSRSTSTCPTRDYKHHNHYNLYDDNNNNYSYIYINNYHNYYCQNWFYNY